MDMTADKIITLLQLEAHPEGGHYRQTWQAAGSGRAAGFTWSRTVDGLSEVLHEAAASG